MFLLDVVKFLNGILTIINNNKNKSLKFTFDIGPFEIIGIYSQEI